MTWTKLSDDYPDDLWTLSDAAFRLHTEALVWSNRKLLDLRIPVDDLRRLAKRPDAADELIAKKVWSVDGDTYVIEHHAIYQRSKEQVITQQSANKANRAKRGLKTPAGRERFNASNDSRNDSLNGSSNERDRTGLVLADSSDAHVLEFDAATGEALDNPGEAGRPSEESVPPKRTTEWPVVIPGSNGQVAMRLGATPEVPPDAHAAAARALDPDTSAHPLCTSPGCSNELHAADSLETGLCHRCTGRLKEGAAP